MKRFSVFSHAFALSVVGILSAHAAASPINSANDIVNVLLKIGRWVSALFWAAAVIAVFYAGFLYLTASDNPERVKKAHKQLLYAIIAIAVALMAYGFPTLIRDILTPTP